MYFYRFRTISMICKLISKKLLPRPLALMGMAIIAIISFGALACGGQAQTEPFESPRIEAAILKSLPEGWNLDEEKGDEIPYGHYYGQEYEGHGGQLLIVIGPQDVPAYWWDESGQRHEEIFAKEAIRFWIMHPHYQNNWLSRLSPHAPIAPTLIYSGKLGRVYAMEGRRTISEEAAQEWETKAIKANSPLDWNRDPISWSNWEDDLRPSLHE